MFVSTLRLISLVPGSALSSAMQLGHDFRAVIAVFLTGVRVHLYVIADCCSGTRPQSFTTYARQALNEIPGLRKGRYLKTYFGKQYKTLLTEFDDTFQKLLYIAKVTQKSPDIPYRSTFGSSRLQ